MRLWRIAGRKWAEDTSCDGARLYGGRWNPIGVPAFYAAVTPELAALEKRVHLSRGRTHPPLKLVAVDLPDDPDLVFQPAITDLPPYWADRTNFADAQEFGRNWLLGAKQLILLVPSVILPEARNAVVNPLHPRYAELQLTVIRDFSFDERLFH
jgi:RES domain-containing protein